MLTRLDPPQSSPDLKLRHEELDWREIEGEIVLLDLRASCYIAVNRSGTILWPLLIEGVERERLIDRLVEHAGITAEHAAVDTDAFVALLRTHDLLER